MLELEKNYKKAMGALTYIYIFTNEHLPFPYLLLPNQYKNILSYFISLVCGKK